MTPTFEDTNLHCPRCDFAHGLHHGDVTIYGRSEDEDQTRKTQISNDGCHASTVASQGCGNPSTRRDGLVISFDCENCGDGLELAIAQHKGATLVSWRHS
jgi:hypothetical protein